MPKDIKEKELGKISRGTLTEGKWMALIKRGFCLTDLRMRTKTTTIGHIFFNSFLECHIRRQMHTQYTSVIFKVVALILVDSFTGEQAEVGK